MSVKILILFVVGLILGAGGALFFSKSPNTSSILPKAASPSPTPFNPFPYQIPQIPAKRSYITFIVGDSNVEALGANANQLRLNLIALSPNHEFVNYNYGYGATNILTLPERLNSQTTYKGTDNPAILTQQFDLIIIESFGYNPLSENSVETGTKKHIETLDASIKQIIKARPNSVVAIMTPIAPSKEFFAKGVYDLSPVQRAQWAEERISYIQAVADYARQRNIPLIDTYGKSLTPSGVVDLKYINKSDYIHPSQAGVDLISKTIADFIYQNKIFPE